jgi:hypothetical protein
MKALGKAAQLATHARYDAPSMAAATLDLYRGVASNVA